MASKIKTYKPRKPRNYIALLAIQKSGSGRHEDRRKAASKKACRGRVQLDG